MSRNKLSVNDFKNWFANQGDMAEFFSIDKESVESERRERFVGKEATAKVSIKKLMERIETVDETTPEDMLAKFLENGGEIVGVDGKMLEIKTEAGTFKLPRFCVKVD